MRERRSPEICKCSYLRPHMKLVIDYVDDVEQNKAIPSLSLLGRSRQNVRAYTTFQLQIRKNAHLGMYPSEMAEINKIILIL